MKALKKILFLLVVLTIADRVSAREYNAALKKEDGLKERQIQSVLSTCTAGITQDQLQINDVRTTILTSGDMWWNLVSAKYEVPKGGGASSIFAGSLWIGGIDAGGQLHIAAMTYRQNGVDYWPGPMDTATLSTTTSECQAYDKHWVVNLSDVQNFLNGAQPTTAMTSWPGNGNPMYNEGHFLAPFYSPRGDYIYNPGNGDYPKFSTAIKTFPCSVTQLFGDQTMWGVFNDEGNIHTETNGIPIGIELRYQCFAYVTSDANNNATFYDYQVINRANTTLNKTYFGVWCDFDLGYFDDDFTGCDVANGVGYGYNGTPVDGNGQPGTYGANPPCVGIDFFRGPKIGEPGDGVDQSGVSFVNPQTGRIQMAKFVYYNNDFSVQGNPTKATDYYNYLSGFWIDGTPFTYGGNAYKGSGPVCDFMFPGSSDPTGLGTKMVPQQAWAEYPTPANPTGDVPGDRRFMESAGPFTLLPGAVNSVTTGVVWARTTNGGNLGSIPLMIDANTLAQALFDNCFQISNGPDAPDLTIQELQNQLIIYLTNKTTSNNYKEKYTEKDPYIKHNLKDSLYKFQGYQVFQITDSSVTEADLYNAAKARLIFECDVKDGVKQIINYYNNTSLAPLWVPQQMVYGADTGITHSFVVNTDQFATSTNTTLVDEKQYYYMAIAYGYNPGEAYSDPNSNLNQTFADGYNGAKDGYNLPYIASRRNVHYTVGMPHIPAPQSGGTQMNSAYGNGVQLTRIEGQGNGGQVLQLTPQSVLNILGASASNPNVTPLGSSVYAAFPASVSSQADGPGGRSVNVTYQAGAGPVKIMVIDPLSVPAGNFQISISDSTPKAKWVLTNLSNGVKVISDTTLAMGNQQIIPQLGLSITLNYVTEIASIATNDETAPNGALFSTMFFANTAEQWLTGLADVDVYTGILADEDWIRSGVYQLHSGGSPAGPFDDYVGVDNSKFFQKIVGATWAPYSMCACTDAAQNCQGGPAATSYLPYNNMGKVLASVDVVITPDKSKWTRCPVIEMDENASMTEGHAAKFSIRRSQSIDQNGNYASGTGPGSSSPNDPAYISRTGMGWFPGYAINIETGERLNMVYGEDSGLPTENGRDMKWNPTSDVFDPTYSYPIFGGKHYIYVFAHVSDLKQASTDKYLPNGPKNMPRYDAGWTAWQLLNADVESGTTSYSRVLYGDAMWVNIPLLVQGQEFLSNQATVQIRVPRKYRRGFSGFYGSANPVDPKIVDTIGGPGEVPANAKPQNRNYPLYSFSTVGMQVNTNVTATAKSALDLINIVPNPYYAYSGYETNQLDNRVRITNLPPTCTVRIFTLNGTLIYTINKADPSTYTDWTLTNQAGIPIASGMYLIYINAPGVGEKVLKWFGVLRPADLSTF